MTDLASLVLKIDSSQASQADAALDRLTASGARAEAGARRLTVATQAEAAALRTVGVSTAQARAGAQQLSFQIGDVAQQFALGTPPMRIFAQQIGQVIQAVNMMRGSAGGLIGFLGGPWGAVIVGAASILGSMAAAHHGAASAADDQKDAADDLKKSIDELHDATVKEIRSAYESVRASIAATEGYRARAVEARKAAIAELELARAKASGANATAAAGGGPAYFTSTVTGAAAAAEAQVRRLDKQIAELNGKIGKTDQVIRLEQGKFIGMRIEEKFDGMAAASGKFKRAQDVLNKELAAGRIGLDEYAARLQAARGQMEREQDALQKSHGAHKKKKEGLSDEAKEYARQLKATDSYIEKLQQEIEGVGKNASELRLLEAAREMAAAKTDKQREAIKRLSEEREAAYAKEAAAEKARDFQNNVLKPLQDELALSGLVGEARERRAAALQAEAIAAKYGAAAAAEYLAAKSQLIGNDAAAELAKQQQEDFLQGLRDMQAATDQTAQMMSDAFGRVGEAIGNLIASQAEYLAVSKKIEADRAAGRKVEAADIAALGRAEVQRNMAAIRGVKSLFSEHSAAYKAMEAIEKAYAIAQLARTIASIAPRIAAGAAKMFEMLGPFAFPAVAAMLGVMAALGFSKGGSSTQTAPEIPTDTQGAGTVLGDPTAKSQSIANSLELMAKNSTKGLDYSQDMVRSLRAIESGIGSLAASVARSLNVQGGFFDTTGKLGTNTSGGFLGLFSTTKTKSLYDQGFTINPSTVANIISNGISGYTYQIIETVKKKSGFLGIGGGTKTSYQTTTGPLDSDFTRQVQLVIENIYKTIVDAAKILGLDVAAALKNFQVQIGQISFKDMKGDEIAKTLEAVFSKVADQMAGFAVSGLEQFQRAGEGLYETLMRLAKDYLTIDAALKSIGMTFGAVGAGSIAARESLIELAGGLDEFVDQVNFFYDHFLTDAQKLAFAQSQVEAAFQAMGVAVPESLDAFTALVQGIDLTTDAGQQLFEKLMEVAPAFYDVATAADQLAKKQNELAVQLLQAQGKTAEATALQRELALAALDPSLRELQQQVWAAQDAAAAASAALSLQNKQTQMQIQLLQAQGKAEEALALQRQLELQQLDPALRDLQQQIYDAQDAAKRQADREQKIAQARDNLVAAYRREADALQQTIDKFSGFAKSLREFRDGLFTSGAGQSASQGMVRLMQQGGLAAAGDEGALGGGLQDAAQQYLGAAEANAASVQDVQRARGLVLRYVDQAIGAAEGRASIAEKQLSALHDQVDRLVDIDDHVLTVAEAVKQLNALTGGVARNREAAAERRHKETVERIDRQNQKLDRIQAASEQAAVSQNATARLLQRFDRGGSLAIVTDDDSPLKVTNV